MITNLILHVKFQVVSRRMAKENEFKLQLQELEDEKLGEADYEEMLRREAERMSVRDFQPKVSTDIPHVCQCEVNRLHSYVAPNLHSISAI